MLFVDAIFFILSKWCRSISSFYLLIARSRRHVTLNKLLKNLDKRPHRRGHPPNVAPSPPNTWFLGPSRHFQGHCRRYLDLFSRFCVARGCDQHTHRPRNIGSNRPRLCTTCMRCGLVVTFCLSTVYWCRRP